MKKLLLPALCAILLLCGCTRTPDTRPEPSAPTDPPQTVESVPAPSEEPPVPEECRLYYDLSDAPLEAERSSTLPAVQGLHNGAPSALYFWRDGQYDYFDMSVERTVQTLSEGRAEKRDGWRRFVWNGTRYSCLYLAAEDSYIPNITSKDGGILWLELTGDCWADGGGLTDNSLFEGFETLVLTGTGTLRVECAGLGNASGELPLPALVVDGPTLITPTISIAANADPSQPGFVLRGGEVQVETLRLNDCPLLQSGGSLEITTCIDPTTAVFRGGECTLESLVREDEAPATLILSGGSFTETDWLPFGTIAYVGAGTLNARGIRYWDTVHVLGGEIIDPLDRENEG